MKAKSYRISVGASPRTVQITDAGAGRMRVVIDGQTREILPLAVRGVEQAWIDGERVVRASVEDVARGLMVTVNGHTVQASVMDERAAAAAAVGPKLTVAAGPTTVRASIPGRVVKILVQVGDVVDDGCPLLVIEAMKMENEIRAPRAGVVAGVAAVVGTAVEAHQDLMTLA